MLNIKPRSHINLTAGHAEELKKVAARTLAAQPVKPKTPSKRPGTRVQPVAPSTPPVL